MPGAPKDIGKKEESGSVAMQTIRMEYINENYKGKLHVFTDVSKDKRR